MLHSPELKQRASQTDNLYLSPTSDDLKFLKELHDSSDFSTCSPSSELVMSQLSGSEFLSEKIAKSTEEVLQAYSIVYSNPEEAIRVAKQALANTQDACIEAYNILAIHAKTYEEALSLYQRAQQHVDQVVNPRLRAQAEKSGELWGVTELRSYMRAMIGEANTLRKMRRNQEALRVYEKLLKVDREYTSYSTYVHYKTLIPEVYMRCGKFREAQKFIREHEHYLDRMSGMVMHWHKALIDYVLDGGQDKWQDSFFESQRLTSGSMIHAVTKAPLVFEYLTALRKFGPEAITAANAAQAGDCPQNQQLCYAVNNLDLWLSQPGAIEFAIRHRNTLVMLLWLKGKDKEQLELMNVRTEKDYLACFNYFYPNAKISRDGMTLLHQTCVGGDFPKRVRAMLDAGASQKSAFHLTPLQMSCYYDRDPKTVAMLIDAGGDPFAGEFSPVMMTCNQGNWRALRTIFLKAPKHKITQSLLFQLFNVLFSTSVYACLKKVSMCQRCSSDSEPHSKYCNFHNCVDILVASGLKLNASQLEMVRRETHNWASDLFAYAVDKLKNGSTMDHLIVDIDVTDLDKTNANMPVVGPTPTVTPKVTAKKKCDTCGTEGVKLMACGRCKKAFYCSKQCQVSAWKQHKLICK